MLSSRRGWLGNVAHRPLAAGRSGHQAISDDVEPVHLARYFSLCVVLVEVDVLYVRCYRGSGPFSKIIVVCYDVSRAGGLI